MQQIFIEGRLTKDPEIKTGTNKEGKEFTLMSFSVAYDTKTSSGVDADGKPIYVNYANVQSWSKNLIDYLQPHLKKGRPVMVIGEPVQNQYKDTEGHKKVALRIAAERILLTELPKKAVAAEEAPAVA